jgi:hypothetical protein
VVGLEGETVTLQDLMVYEIQGEDGNGRIIGRHRTTGIARPNFWPKARYFGEDKRLTEALTAGEVFDEHGRWESALLSPELVQIAAILLAGLGVGGIVYVIAMPYLGGERKASKRVANVAEGQTRIRSRMGMQQQPLTMRKKQIQDTSRTSRPSRGCRSACRCGSSSCAPAST